MNDLRMFVRIMKGDLKIQVAQFLSLFCKCINIHQAGAKHILDGLHPDAYEAFNSGKNIEAVVAKVSRSS